jgi:hypothetical protein
MGNMFLHLIKSIDNIGEIVCLESKNIWNRFLIRTILLLNKVAPRRLGEPPNAPWPFVVSRLAYRSPNLCSSTRGSNENLKRKLVHKDDHLPFV